MSKSLFKTILLFLIGFCTYITIEVCFRGYSYILMGCCGGLIILILDKINDVISWNTDLIIQGLCGSALTTLLELIIGEIALHTELIPVMWDYSNMPINFDGVICLPFSILWFFISLIAIFIADAINYYVLNEPQVPYYNLFGKTIIRFKKVN